MLCLDIETRPGRRIWELSEAQQLSLVRKTLSWEERKFRPDEKILLDIERYKDYFLIQGTTVAEALTPFKEICEAELSMSLNPALCEIVCIGLYMSSVSHELYTKYVGESESHPHWPPVHALNTRSDAFLLLSYEPLILNNLSQYMEVLAPDLEGVNLFFRDKKEMFQILWNLVDSQKIITFNGRSFDLPILQLHSVAAGVPLGRKLVGERFKHEYEIDLADVLSCYGAGSMTSFDNYCTMFDIPSPKAGEVSGKSVAQFALDGKLEPIFKYQMKDVTALAKMAYKVRTLIGDVYRL